MSWVVRLAGIDDLGPINDIYNYYVNRSTCTYQESLESIEQRQDWFAQHGPDHPVTVAVDGDQVVGWGALSRFHARSAYRFTVENSVYVDHRYQRRGIGDAILSDLIVRARTLGHRTIIAGIDGEQAGSIAIHARHGFVHAGHLKAVGYKFDRWLDVIYMQLTLTPNIVSR
jgi:L-amino acid N-acyltransferase